MAALAECKICDKHVYICICVRLNAQHKTEDKPSGIQKREQAKKQQQQQQQRTLKQKPRKQSIAPQWVHFCHDNALLDESSYGTGGEWRGAA